MPKMPLQSLPDDSRIWIFGISPALDARGEAAVLERVDGFLAVAVDKRSETSGCSIDRMFGIMRQLERELGVSILDAARVFYRGADAAVHAVSRGDFRDRGDLHTRVFDTTAERLGEVRSGSWERPASESWHRQLLG